MSLHTKSESISYWFKTEMNNIYHKSYTPELSDVDIFLIWIASKLYFTTYDHFSEHIFAQLAAVLEHSVISRQLCQETFPSTVKALFKREQLIAVEMPQGCFCLSVFFSLAQQPNRLMYIYSHTVIL